MPVSSSPIQPAVEWAQRKDLVYLSINIESKDAKIDVTTDKLHVSGHGGPDQQPFDVDVEFFKPIDESKVRRVPSNRNMQFIVPKQESGPFWPRLLKSDKKVHWVKVDFDKWKDEEDESDTEAGEGGPGGANWNFEDMMGKMGGYDGKPNFDDYEGDEGEALPDLEDDNDEGDEDEEKNQFADAEEPVVEKGKTKQAAAAGDSKSSEQAVTTAEESKNGH